MFFSYLSVLSMLVDVVTAHLQQEAQGPSGRKTKQTQIQPLQQTAKHTHSMSFYLSLFLTHTQIDHTFTSVLMSYITIIVFFFSLSLFSPTLPFTHPHLSCFFTYISCVYSIISLFSFHFSPQCFPSSLLCHLSSFPSSSPEGLVEAVPLALFPFFPFRLSPLVSHLLNLPPSLVPVILPSSEPNFLTPHPCPLPSPSSSSVLLPLYSVLPSSRSRTNQNEPGIDPFCPLLRWLQNNL